MKFITEANRAQFKYARALTAHHAKSFYFSAAMLPGEKRWATYALYGFCRYVDNLIDNPRERTAAEIKHELNYLRRELTIGYRTGESEHPVLKPFISVAKQYNIEKRHAVELIKGVLMDIEKQRYENFDELYLFAYRVAGVVGLMMTPILGAKNPEALVHAEKLGIAMQLTNILRDIKEDKNMDRIYLPLEEIRQFGVDPDDIFNERMTEGMRNLMKFQVDRAHAYYDEADAGIKMLDRDAQFAIYSASKIYRGILRKIEMRDYNPFLGRVFVPNGKKISIVAGEVLRTRALSFGTLLSNL
jgi:phytoene synthase